MTAARRRAEEDGSVAQGRPWHTVEASPFNGVKLALAGWLAVGLLVFLLTERLLDTGWLQVAALGAYGIAAAAWTVWRTRAVLRSERHGSRDG